MFPESPYDFGSPILELKEPLSPFNLFFLNTIFMIPAVPSASYLADGEVMISTFSTLSDGNCFSASLLLIPTNPEGLPLISIVTLWFPLSETFPSTSTATDGRLSKTSLTLLPLTV